jgi:hypothetical protein
MRKLFFAVFLIGCMPFKYYPLPVSAGEARATFAPIATAASNHGYKQWRWEDSVSFEPDAFTRVSYQFDVSGNYQMCVILKDKNPPGGVEAAFAAGKQKGDEIWNEAMALRPAPPPPPVQYVSPPQPGVQININ